MVVHIVLAKMSEREWSILSSSPTISAWNKCMELVVAGWCTRKWLRFDQIIRNLTSGDCGISLLLIRLGVTGLRKTRVVYFLDLFEGRAEKQQCDLVCVVCLQMIGLILVYVVNVLFTCGKSSFNSLGSWSYSKEWVWNLGTKSMLYCIREVKCQQGDTPGISYQKRLL